MLQPEGCPLARRLYLEGEKLQIVSKVKYLGIMLDANGAMAEALGGMAGSDGAIGGNGGRGVLVRGMQPAGAAHIYDAFVASTRRRDVSMTPLAPTDTKTTNNWA
jgi:uncharacterized protein YidB (DUF937 family)